MIGVARLFARRFVLFGALGQFFLAFLGIWLAVLACGGPFPRLGLGLHGGGHIAAILVTSLDLLGGRADDGLTHRLGLIEGPKVRGFDPLGQDVRLGTLGPHFCYRKNGCQYGNQYRSFLARPLQLKIFPISLSRTQLCLAPLIAR
jgi:hypothetical protein